MSINKSLQKRQNKFYKRLIKREKYTGEYQHLKRITPYISSTTKIKFKCLDCGLVFTKLPYYILHSSYICTNKSYQYGFRRTRRAHLFTLLQIKRLVRNLAGDKYIVLSKHYKNSHTKLFFEHASKSCIYYKKYHKFYKFKKSWHSFKAGHFCPEDGRFKSQDKIRITESKFKQKICKQTHGEYLLKSKYFDIHTDVLMEHHSKLCPYYREHRRYYQWWTNPTGFIYSKCRCPMEHYAKISRLRSKSTDQYKREIFKVAGKHFKLLSRYKGEHTKVVIKHESKQCSYYKKYGKYFTFSVLPTNFLAHPICQCDKMSCGEKAVMMWLNRHKLIQHKDYIYAYILKHRYCTKHRQHLDFYLSNLVFNDYYINGVGIEFDGAQHYKMVDFTFNNRDDYHILRACNNLIDNMLRDRAKDKYCYKNRIKLIRIKNDKNYHGKKLCKLVNNTLNQQLLPVLQHYKNQQLSLFN